MELYFSCSDYYECCFPCEQLEGHPCSSLDIKVGLKTVEMIRRLIAVRGKHPNIHGYMVNQCRVSPIKKEVFPSQ